MRAAVMGSSFIFDEVRSQIGKGGDQLLPVFVPRERLEHLQEPMEQFRGELFKRDYLPRVKPFPRVRDLFERIKRDGHRIGSRNTKTLRAFPISSTPRRPVTMWTDRSHARMCSR